MSAGSPTEKEDLQEASCTSSVTLSMFSEPSLGKAGLVRMDVFRGPKHLKARPPHYHGTHRGRRMWCCLHVTGFSQASAHACSQATVRRNSPIEAANQIELAVAHFCFNQAVRFANVLPEVPSKPSLFAPCVESSFGECISIKISLADFAKVIKCCGSFVIKSWSPFWNSCFCP